MRGLQHSAFSLQFDRITVYTSDCKYAGTDADVVCTLYGTTTDGAQVESPPDMLLSNSKNNFERARVDVFDLPPMADLGELSQIRIGHNNSGTLTGLSACKSLS